MFLVHVSGRRRCRIITDPEAPKDFRADSELKLLREFSPTHEWVLEPGDALYLPPGVPHDGVAIGACMTFSIGMRAPAQAELLMDFAEFLAAPLGEEQRYTDPDLTPTHDSGEIDAAALKRVRATLPHFSNVDISIFASWFGRFITTYRAAHEAAPPARTLSPAQIAARLPGARLLRNPWSRMAWTRHDRNAELFVAGHGYQCPIVLAHLIASARELDGDAVLRLGKKTALPLLADLVNAGHLQAPALALE